MYNSGGFFSPTANLFTLLLSIQIILLAPILLHVTMRQLLNRKSANRLADQEIPDSKPRILQPASDLGGERRVFPLRSPRSNVDVRGSTLNTKTDTSVSAFIMPLDKGHNR